MNEWMSQQINQWRNKFIKKHRCPGTNQRQHVIRGSSTVTGTQWTAMRTSPPAPSPCSGGACCPGPGGLARSWGSTQLSSPEPEGVRSLMPKAEPATAARGGCLKRVVRTKVCGGHQESSEDPRGERAGGDEPSRSGWKGHLAWLDFLFALCFFSKQVMQSTLKQPGG